LVLRELHLSSFKCFETLDLSLRPLTVLSGHNSGGKSSVIQALVLLAQTFREHEWGPALLLNGSELSIGSAADVLNQAVGGRELELGIATETQRVRWVFRTEDRRALALTLRQVSIDGVDRPIQSSNVRWLLPSADAESSDVVRTVRRTSWISAERSGPREILPLLDPEQHARVGARGELAAGLLHWRESDEVLGPLCISGEIKTLFHQVRSWMRQFFPGSDLKLTPVDGANAVTLRMKSDAKAEFQRLQNLGFGLSQLFPILVAVLAAKPGDVLLVENPEVHLHPRAQQDVGFLLSQVASSGVQVVVETHSDHVLNGIRLATKKAQINPANVAVHFFMRSSVDGTPKQMSPALDTEGRFSEWPAGFFDQYDAALSELL
jgi:predicted ATPase